MNTSKFTRERIRLSTTAGKDFSKTDNFNSQTVHLICRLKFERPCLVEGFNKTCLQMNVFGCSVQSFRFEQPFDRLSSICCSELWLSPKIASWRVGKENWVNCFSRRRFIDGQLFNFRLAYPDLIDCFIFVVHHIPVSPIVQQKV